MKREGFSLMSSNKGFYFLFFLLVWLKCREMKPLSAPFREWAYLTLTRMMKDACVITYCFSKKKKCQYQKSKRVKIKKGDYFGRLSNSKTVPTFVQYSSSSWIELRDLGFWLGAVLESTTTTTISSPLHSLILLEYRPNTFLSPLFPSLAYFLENVSIH